MKRVVVFGATSAVAQAIARIYAEDKAHLLLIGRREEVLADLSADLKIRGAMHVESLCVDLADTTGHDGLIEKVFSAIEEPNIFIFANGTLPEQSACEKDFALTMDALNQNAISQISLISRLANILEKRGTGTIAAITSVAGDRGRLSNYVYGAAKGMLSKFLQGLRHRLSKSNVSVLDIKPGFIDTPMTAHIDKKGLLWAKPENVATDIIKAIDKKKSCIYTPWFWRYIMLIIRSVPNFIFHKTNL